MFQRTPQWLFEHDGYLTSFPPQVTWLDRNLPYHANFMRFRTNWLLGPYLPGFPNLFLIYGPNMNPYGGLGVVNHEEMVTR